MTNVTDEKSRVGFTVMVFVLLSLLYCKCCMTRCSVMMQIPFVYVMLFYLFIYLFFDMWPEVSSKLECRMLA